MGTTKMVKKEIRTMLRAQGVPKMKSMAQYVKEMATSTHGTLGKELDGITVKMDKQKKNPIKPSQQGAWLNPKGIIAQVSKQVPDGPRGAKNY